MVSGLRQEVVEFLAKYTKQSDGSIFATGTRTLSYLSLSLVEEDDYTFSALWVFAQITLSLPLYRGRGKNQRRTTTPQLGIKTMISTENRRTCP